MTFWLLFDVNGVASRRSGASRSSGADVSLRESKGSEMKDGACVVDELGEPEEVREDISRVAKLK
jgi:hypothetical protein